MGKSPVDAADILRVKNFLEIALSRSISKINRFLRFTQKFKMAAKSGGKKILQKVASRLHRHPGRPKFRPNRSILLRYQDKLVFAFIVEIQDDFCKKLPVDFADTLWVKIFGKIALSRSVSEINVFLHFQR